MACSDRDTVARHIKPKIKIARTMLPYLDVGHAARSQEITETFLVR